MDIVEEIRKDRENGAKRLVSEYKNGLLTLARRFCSDVSDAEELVNRTFAEVLANIDRYAEQSAFFGWMCQILSNLHANDCRRKSNANTVYPGDVPDVADWSAQEAIFSGLDHESLRDAIEQLPKDIRKAVILHYFEEMPVREVARILRTPTGTIAWRLHCAREILAAKLSAGAKKAVSKSGAKALLIALALVAVAAVGAVGVVAIRSAAEPEAEESEVVFNAKSTENTEGALTGLTGLPAEGTDPEPAVSSLSSQAPASNHESRTTNHETNGDSPQQSEAITANSETNNEETTMNTQVVKSAAVKALAAGAMLAAAAVPAKSTQADGIPDGYTEVEYIQGNGSNARIVTDYIPKPNLDKIEAVVEFPSSTLGANQVIWCARYGAQDTTWTLFVRNDSKYRFDYGSPSSLSDTLSPALTEGVKYTVTAEGNEFRSFDANGQTHSFSPAEVADFTAGGPLELFVSYNNGNPNNNLSSYGKHRLYSFKVWRSGKLLHYFVPCIRTSDSKAMLVDVYDNTTQLTVTGTFSAGEAGHYYDDALVSKAKKGRWPNNYTEVEFIQGNGTDARFITDYTPTPNADKIEAVIEFPSETLGANQVVWCARYNAQNTTWTLFVRDDSQYRFDYGSPSAVSATLSPALVEGVKYTVTAEGNEFRSSGTNGQTHATSPDKVADFTAGGPLVLFSAYDKGLPSYTPTSWGKFRLYSFKVWYSGKLVHYFVPCIKASNGKATMVDICDDPATLTREGTFTAGPEGHYYDDMLFRPAGTVYYIL